MPTPTTPALNARRRVFRTKAEREVKRAGEALARLRLLARQYAGHYEESDSDAIVQALETALGDAAKDLRAETPTATPRVEW